MEKITKELIQKFELHLYEEEKSINTVEKYLRDIRFFANWLDERSLDKITVLDYKKFLCEKYALSSVNSILSSLNAFFSFFDCHTLKVKTVKIQRLTFADKDRELTKTEYEKLLASAKEIKNYRLYCLMQTIGSTGIRISELKFITCEAVKSGIAKINCKGKVRQILLSKRLCKLLKSYTRKMKIFSGSVFVSKNGSPLDRSNIWKMLKNLCKIAGVSSKKVFPHNFRHLFARTFYSMQKDIVRLADILGHSNVNTTRIYTMETGENHRKLLQNLGLVMLL